MTTKFQFESAQQTLLTDRLENLPMVSDESVIANLESVILGLCIRNEISNYDEKTLDSLFTGKNRLFIVKENNCIYPAGVEQNEFSLCLDFNANSLNVCDLDNNFPHLVARIENVWPLLLAVVSRIRETFETSDAALLINRTSGRVMASSVGFTSITGFLEDTLIGAEYSAISAEFEKFFEGKKLKMSNFHCDEVHLVLLSVSSPASSKSTIPANLTNPVSNEKSHRFIDELQEVGMHINRFNALLETNLNNAIPTQTLKQVESVISKMCGCIALNSQNQPSLAISTNANACIRLMIQSLLMAHRTIAGKSAKTEILVYRNEHNELNIRFDTPVVLSAFPQMTDNEWYRLAVNLSKRIDVTIGDLQYALNSVCNKIYFTNERKVPNDKR